MAKKDISRLKFKSIVGWRGDSLACPQAFGGDIYSGCSMGCWWCFCREMEEELFTKYYTGWSRDLVRGCAVEKYEQLFDKAFGSDKQTNDWLIKCLRYGLPFNMGSKAETFCIEDFDHNLVVPVLELFRDYKVPIIIETKSHYIGLQRYMDILKDMKVAVIVAIMGGSDTLNYQLEPGAPMASMRWALVKELNELGIWTAVRWEPIMVGINSKEEYLKKYAQIAKRTGCKHVSLFNYRSSNTTIAHREFTKRGYDYIKLLERNKEDNWRPIGKKFFEILHQEGMKASSPDFVNFPFDADCESCCGVDGLFKSYHFTFQYACKLIKEKGFVEWEDMEKIEFREMEAYERMKGIWNGRGAYYSLAHSPEIEVLDEDKKGMRIYGKKEGIKGYKDKGFGL